MMFETDHFIVYFGNRNESRDDLIERFAPYQLRFIKQTHSDICVQASDQIMEADAHWSTIPSDGVLVQTADCLPVVGFDPKRKMIIGIHAGWRGLVNRIIPKTLSHLKVSPDTQLWFGPHYQSFESHLDVALTLSQSVQNGGDLITPHADPEKRYVDLTEIAKRQLEEVNLKPTWVSPVDTFKSQEHHSWRRDQAPGRQWSLIILKTNK